MAQGVYVSFCLYTNSFLAILKALQQTQGRRVVNGLELSAMVYLYSGTEMRSSCRQLGRPLQSASKIALSMSFLLSLLFSSSPALRQGRLESSRVRRLRGLGHKKYSISLSLRGLGAVERELPPDLSFGIRPPCDEALMGS
jgi:hypothetical protein